MRERLKNPPSLRRAERDRIETEHVQLAYLSRSEPLRADVAVGRRPFRGASTSISVPLGLTPL